MRGFLFFIICSVLVLTAACESATRTLVDKDTAVTDTTGDTDADTVQTDDIQTDGIQTDDIQTDDVQSDDIQTDDILPDGPQGDGDSVQNDQNVPDNDMPPKTCADITCDDPNSTCVEGTGGADAVCECNENYHWNSGECIKDELTKTGEFEFDFTGAINETTDPQQLQGGDGTAIFSHLGDDLTYVKITVPYGNIGFPLANLQNGTTITTIWLEKLAMSGSVKFFAFSMPATQNTAGTKQLADTQSVVMYGDMTMSGGAMNIECVRAMSADGSYTVAGDSGNGTLHISTASGNMYDPKVAEASLPAPICAE